MTLVNGQTDFLQLPAGEAERTIEALGRAEKAGEPKSEGAADRKALLKLEDEIAFARDYLEKAAIVHGEIVDEYFNETVNNPETARGQEHILLFYDETRIKSHIVQDYVIQTQNALIDMAKLVKEGREAVQTPTKVQD